MPSAPSGWSSRWRAYHGLAYMRTSRPKTDIIYGLDEQFPIGGSKVLYQSATDVATVVAAGVTVFEALKAYVQLKGEHIQHPRHRRLLRAADRRRHAHRRGQGHQRRDHHGRGSLRCRAVSATPSAKPSRRPGSSSIASPCARCRAAARPPSCSITTASPPGTSSTPCESCPEGPERAQPRALRCRIR